MLTKELHDHATFNAGIKSAHISSEELKNNIQAHETGRRKSITALYEIVNTEQSPVVTEKTKYSHRK